MTGNLATAGLILLITGALLVSLSAIVLRWNAFRKSIGWGCACMFLPLADIVFVVRFWHTTRRLFLGQLAGTLAMLAGAGILMQDPICRANFHTLLNSNALIAQDEADMDAAFTHPSATPPPRDLQQWYAALQKRRPGPDATADQIRAYNEECAEYTAQKQQQTERSASK